MGTYSPQAAGAAGIATRRRENLALAYQEVLTAVVRLRTNRQVVTDSELFRGQMREALSAADQEGRKRGYNTEQTRMATFAVVAFLDESIMNLQQPIFAQWPRKPLQEELFGVHVAGEIFFNTVQRLLGQQDSDEVADVLEIYLLCLLLGFRGRYGIGGQAEFALGDRYPFGQATSRTRLHAGPFARLGHPAGHDQARPARSLGETSDVDRGRLLRPPDSAVRHFQTVAQLRRFRTALGSHAKPGIRTPMNYQS